MINYESFRINLNHRIIEEDEESSKILLLKPRLNERTKKIKPNYKKNWCLLTKIFVRDNTKNEAVAMQNFTF